MGKNELLPGTLDMMVFKTLTRGALHGYAIAQLLRQLSEDILQVEEGSLYPVRSSAWNSRDGSKVSGVSRRITGGARFYKLTSDGEKLASETSRYREMTGAIARVMGLA